MQKDARYPTEQEWHVFFNENHMALACTEDFKRKLLKHPRVIEIYEEWLKQRKETMKEYNEREQEFLKELTDLSHKYKILISGCGCCGSPALEDFSDKKEFNLWFKDPSNTCSHYWRDVKVSSVEYVYEDQLSFSGVKE